MDIFFQDPNEIPVPPADVRIRDLQVKPLSDGRRVRVYLELDPFQKRPSAELVVRNASGTPVAAASIVESMTRKIEITLHLRNVNEPGIFTMETQIYYQKGPSEPPEGEEDRQPELGEKLIVDQGQITFETFAWPNYPLIVYPANGL